MTEHASGLVDGHDRERALDPTGSFIVQAPAGSGKTELLTQRYLRLLALVDEPEEVLAMTFTNKASGEMRERILGALELARGPMPTEPHKQQTWRLANAALARDKERGWAIASYPARLAVQTMDSLCASLIRQLPLLSRAGAEPSINDQPDQLYADAAEQTLCMIDTGGVDERKALAALLNHLDNDRRKTASLLAGMLAKRDQWLRPLRAHAGSLNREAMERALKSCVESELLTAIDTIKAHTGFELLEYAHYAGRAAQAFAPDHMQAVNADLSGWPAADASALAQWQAVSAIAITKTGGWRKTLTRGDAFPTAKELPEPLASTAKEMKDGMLAWIKAHEDNDLLREALTVPGSLPKPVYGESQWQIVDALLKILPLAAAQLQLRFIETSSVDFCEVSLRAVEALGSEQAPSDLALALDHRLRHLLVDEFQDTSFRQYELLRGLTAGWTDTDGRTLFVVGDPMQSIYRFREAEVGLYLNAREQGIGDIRLEALRLEVNFRSSASLVNWFNMVCGPVFPKQTDAVFGAVPYAESVAIRQDPETPNTDVVVHPQVSSDTPAARIAEAQQVVDIAANALSRGSVAILYRGRSQVADIVAELRARGLRFRATDLEKLDSQPVVRDLTALTFALTHPADRVAWLAILRAPWCGLPLTELLPLVGDDPNDIIWRKLLESVCPRVVHLREALQPFITTESGLGLRDRVYRAWRRLGGPECYSDNTIEANAKRYLDLLDRFDDAGDLTDRAGLITSLDKLYAATDPGADDAIQLMTIHRSKGLEFDTVILAGLGRGSGRDQRPLLRWEERLGSHGSDLLLAPILPNGVKAEPVHDFLQAIAARRADNELVRLLYVAVTRARDSLHLFGTVGEKDDAYKPPAKGSLLALLWPALEPLFADCPISRNVADGNADTSSTRNVELQRLPANWKPMDLPVAVGQPEDLVTTNPEAPIEFDWAGELARHVGTVAHRLLQLLAEADDMHAINLSGQRAALAKALATLGVSSEDSAAAVNRVAEIAERTLADRRGRWILGEGTTESASELPLTGMIDGRINSIVIDRTFVDTDGTRWIVDFKTSDHAGGDIDAFLDKEQERYAAQLERYAALMLLRDSRPLQLALYYPAFGGWREWTPPNRR